MWLLVSRGGGDNPSSSANRLAGNWFYQLFTLSTTSPAALGKNIVFHLKWVWKNHLKTKAVQSLVGEKLLKRMKPPIEQALFINVE